MFGTFGLDELISLFFPDESGLDEKIMLFMKLISINGIAEVCQKAASSLRFEEGDVPSPLPLAASSRRKRIEGDLSQSIAIALLILSLPNASAQEITERNPNQDFNTLGLAGGNKNLVGLCAVTNPNNNKTYMQVSDRDGENLHIQLGNQRTSG